jgi:hypothetical protein
MRVSVNMDVLYEVLSRGDGVTLATAACAGSPFHSISNNEKVWEKLCSRRWPSTRDPEVSDLIDSMGGYRRFYGECFPLIVSKHPFIFDASDVALKDEVDWFDDEQDMIEELSNTSLDDYVSVVDVVFRGRPVAFRVLHGIPGASDLHGWFSSCPFRIDLLSCSGYGGDGDEILITDDLPELISIERERKDGRLWRAIWEEIEVSWIVIDKKTKRMANFASPRPLTGQRHWPSDTEFSLTFGSILPAHEWLSRKVVQCDVILKFKLLCEDFGCPLLDGHMKKSCLVITELSMQLEDMAGAHLNGRHSMLALKSALSCHKSADHRRVLRSYRQYIRARSELKEEKLKNEGWVDTMCIVCAIALCILFLVFSL